MAYKINRDDEHIVLPDGPATVRDIQRYVKDSPEFYELEPAEVLEVFLDEEDLMNSGAIINQSRNGEPMVDWSKYGWIKARMSVSNSGKEDVVIIAPLDSNIKEYPHPGEYVIVAKYFGDLYYTQKLNMHNSINLNSFPGLSKVYDMFTGETYKDNLPLIGNSDIRQVKAEEGDIIFNGRFGQSIKFGSNVKELIDADGDLVPDTGEPHSPNVIIRAGQGEVSTENNKPVRENINLDGSSIWMTTNQKVNLNFSTMNSKFVSIYSHEAKKNDGGKQIVINSDRLVFNAKSDKSGIVFSSNSTVGISANKEIGVVVPPTGKVKLGDYYANQPALGGDLTMELFEKLITYLIGFANGIKGAKGSVVDFVVPISDILPSAMGLVASLNELKTRMDEPKSKTVQVGHIMGPQ